MEKTAAAFEHLPLLSDRANDRLAFATEMQDADGTKAYEF